MMVVMVMVMMIMVQLSSQEVMSEGGVFKGCRAATIAGKGGKATTARLWVVDVQLTK